MIQNPSLIHQIKYKIEVLDNSVKLISIFYGELGKKMIEISLKPIIHGIMIDELRNMKSAVESSDYIFPINSKSKKLKPI